MNGLKKFWITFLSFLPFAAGAASPLVIGGIAGVGIIAGFSIYRTAVPVNMSDAMNFFSTCWTCQMFSDIMRTMSDMIPRVYSAIGSIMLPMSAGLLGVWAAWQLTKGFMNATVDKPWATASLFTTKMIRLTIIGALMLAPLPRILTDVVIEPIFNVGLATNRIIAGDDTFDKCVIATAIADPTTASVESATAGAFSPRLRHNLACEVANVHQMTGLGLTVGWTMMNMAFDYDYMHKFLWAIPIFPNVILFFVGLMVMALFFFALLPVPVYFLEVFITLSLDLVMLPLMLLSWLFEGWKILPGGGKSIKSIVNDVVKSTVGIAMIGIFITFAVMFINAVFGDWNGASNLATAMAQNDSKLLIDGLMMRNDSLVTIILMGVFIAMFMTSIPALIKTLFKFDITDNFYPTIKKNIDTLWNAGKKIWENAKK